MNKEQFISYLTTPSKLDNSTLEELDALIKDFPYFQSARILYTLNLYKENNVRYDAQLKTTALYAGNRNILRKHISRIERAKPDIAAKPEPAVEPAEKNSEDNSPVKTEPQSKSPEKIEYETPHTAVSGNEEPAGTKTSEEDTIVRLKKIIEQRIREIEKEKKQMGGEQKSKPLSKKSKLSLIDEFINSQPAISRAKSKFYDPVDKAKESIVDQEDIVSDTLASIYMDQGYYEKAIKMYEKLILKFPEKSSYFAPLIKKADKELKNKN